MLEENMRHRGDPVWRDILLRWRFGEYRQEDIDLVNFHCYENNWTSEASKNLKAFCPILVTSNAVREDFNKLAAMDFCKRMKQPLHYFPAVVTHSKFHLSPSQRRSLAPIRSDKTGGLPMLMTLAIGLPMQCTKNVSRVLHLANGTIGTVVGFQVSHSDSERVELGADLEFHFHTKPAHAIFLQLHDRSLAHYSILDALPPGTTPVRCAKHTGVNVAMSDRTFTVSVDQVPLVPAFALTTEKCQGLTVEKVVLGPLRHFTRVQPQRSSFYVAVTRVTTMLQLYLVEPLTLDFLKYFTPSRAALEETSRLHELEQLCDRRHATTQQV